MPTQKEIDSAILAARQFAATGKPVSADAQKAFADKWGADAYKKAFLPAGSEAATIDYTPARSALAGAGQGLSLGFMDEIGGAAQAVGAGARGLADVVTGPTKLRDVPGQVAEAYRGGRDTMRDYAKTAEMINPRAYKTGEIGGAILPIAATAGGAAVGQAAARGLAAAPAAVEAAAPVVRAAVPAVKESMAALGKRLASSAGTGAVIGGAQGTGYSEKDAAGTAGDVIRGATVGAAVGGAVPAVGKLLREGIDVGKKVGTAVTGSVMGGVPEWAMKYRSKFGGEKTMSGPTQAELAMDVADAANTAGMRAQKHSQAGQEELKKSGVKLTELDILSALKPAEEKILDRISVDTATPIIDGFRRMVSAEFPKVQQAKSKIVDAAGNLIKPIIEEPRIGLERITALMRQLSDDANYGTKEIAQAGREAGSFKAARAALREFVRDKAPNYAKHLDDAVNEMEIVDAAKKLSENPQTLGQELMQFGAGKIKLKRDKKTGSTTDVGTILDKLSELTGKDYVALAENAAARKAFEVGAEKTGLNVAGGMFGGNLLATGAMAAGADPMLAYGLGNTAGGLAGLLRSYYGPRAAGAVVDAASAVGKTAPFRGAAALAGGGSEVAGQVLPSAIRTGMISPEQQNRAPQALTPSELQKARDRLRMQR